MTVTILKLSFFVLLIAIPSASPLVISTWNLLAPCHKNSEWVEGARESTHEGLWRPRTEALVGIVHSQLSSSDIICLQEFWWDDNGGNTVAAAGDACQSADLPPPPSPSGGTSPSHWEKAFSSIPGFDLLTARRPQGRSDGLGLLVKSTLKCEWSETIFLPTSTRIGLCVCVKDRAGRKIVVGNVHLPFPTTEACRELQSAHLDAVMQVVETRAAAEGASLCIVAGDFNCRFDQPACRRAEERGWTSGLAAVANQAIASGVGGVVDLGVTHRNHLGEAEAVDHIFCRTMTHDGGFFGDGYGTGGNSTWARAQGFLGAGLRITDANRHAVEGLADWAVSDHCPVTCKLEWPTEKPRPLEGPHVSWSDL